MADIWEWNKFRNLAHELALVEDDLRTAVVHGNQRASAFAAQVLWERFGVTSDW